MIVEPERHIHLRIITSPDAARLVGFNVYRTAVPKDASFPFVVYKRANTAREIALNTPLHLPVTSIQIAAWADTPELAGEVGDEIRRLFHGYIGTLANATIQDMRLISEVEDFLDPIASGAQLPLAYEVRQLYHFRWQESDQ